MRRLSAVALTGALALGGAVTGFLSAPGAGASPPTTVPAQTAACSAASPGYAACLVHVFHHRPGGHGDNGYPSGAAGPQTSTPTGYSPAEVKGAYGFTGTAVSGKTVAIVDAYGDPTITSNLATFDSEYGLTCSGCFTKVSQTGGSTSGLRTTSGWVLETSLDVEWVHAMAPDAKVLLVEATNNSFTNLFAAVSYAAAHASYVSMSWGGTETSSETSEDSHFSTAGVSFFAATGDSASEVIYPSSSPHVVSVGGTTLTLTRTSDTWEKETAWSTAGGGCSRYETASTAQSAYVTYAQAKCSGKRGAPDISLDANPDTGVAVYDTREVTGLVDWIQVGGTSASTAMIAGHAASTGEQVDATVVYGGSLKIYNVTSGSNGHACETGYNLCTGLGSWNTAVGTSSTGGGTVGSLSFTSSPQSLTAGNESAAFSVALSQAAPATGLTVTVSTSSATGELSTSSTGSSASHTLTLHVAASGTAVPTFYYEDTKAGSPTITVAASGFGSATQTETVTASTLRTLHVSPTSATVAEGGSQELTATGVDAYTNPVTVDPTWSVTPGLGTFAPASGATTTFKAGSSTGSGTVTATTGGVHGTATVTVTATPALSVTLAAGTSSERSHEYSTPLTASVTSSGKAVRGAKVTVTVYSGTCTTGARVASGTGTTGTGGTAAFTFTTRTTGSYCAAATATDTGYTSGSATVTFTVPTAAPKSGK